MTKQAIYLVGGAVRDQLLGRPVKERDWVVVGSTSADMLALGFQPVGKAFPVFLHPETKEEYALARTERKSGRGYHGFVCDASSSVTLEQDLMRRDLTINAIAQDKQGQLIDPYHGQRDVQKKILRHVSAAFAEDPVRILRVARFAARFHALGFSIAEETMALMQTMVAEGEVNHLQPERVWLEFDKALMENDPQVFIQVLRDCHALERLFPEIDRLFGVPNPSQHHPEIDTGIHTLMVLAQAAKLSPKPSVRFAALMHDVGKALTPADSLPSHPGHGERGVPLIEAYCQRYPVPTQYKRLAILVARYHIAAHKSQEMRPGTLVDLLESIDVLRRPERFEDFLLACEADCRGRLGLEHIDYQQGHYLRQALACLQAVDIQSVIQKTTDSLAIKEAVRQARIRALRRWREKG